MVSTNTDALAHFCEEHPAVSGDVDPKLGVIRHLRGGIARCPDQSADGLRSTLSQLIADNRPLFGDVNIERAETICCSKDRCGGCSITLQQYHGQVRVYGGSVRCHIACDGTLDAVHNQLVPDLRTVPQESKVSPAAAIHRAQRRCGTSEKPCREPELLVYPVNGEPRLVWQIHVRGRRKRRDGLKPSWVVLVDAIENTVVDRYDNTQTMAASTGQGTGHYSGPGAVNSFRAGPAAFHLRDITRTEAGGIEIRTMKGTPPSLSQTDDNRWTNIGTNPRNGNQGAEVDCHRYLGQALDYFAVLGRQSLDQNRSPIEVVVHASEPQTGLVEWSGARWNPDQRRIEVGDGDGQTWDYLCAADWMCHELTHGVIQDSCNLEYRGESGALNEAFCDTFAAFITGSWSHFAQTWKPNGPSTTGQRKAYRNLADPNNGSAWKPARPRAGAKSGCLPDHYSKRYKGSFDNRGVHINSAIVSHALFLLSEGGTHRLSQINVRGVGKTVAERMLFQCMNRYLVGRPRASFADLRLAMLDAAREEFAGDVDALLQTKRAFNAVGIGPALMVRDIAGSTPAQPLVSGRDNPVLVKIENRGTATEDVSVSLFVTAPGAVHAPASWTPVGKTTIAKVPGDTTVTAGPIVIPAARIPASGTLALIATAENPMEPLPDWATLPSPGAVEQALKDAANIAVALVPVS